MAKSKRTYFTVHGNSIFPFDMLRYDSCWPIDDNSVVNISLCNHDLEKDEEPRNIRMCTEGHGPTENRWRSFGWIVSHISDRQYT